ncbi:hypothetical protein E2C01_006696 [Portunus trituberculatus]|uniref:Uncharacterized protein n=1 Tax=Portunus trituberculatus TaxID=210409 RepID=A0A5B7D0D2_PORTR|nr:hypothetical protein [Portunus trituberculatus]
MSKLTGQDTAFGDWNETLPGKRCGLLDDFCYSLLHAKRQPSLLVAKPHPAVEGSWKAVKAGWVDGWGAAVSEMAGEGLSGAGWPHQRGESSILTAKILHLMGQLDALLLVTLTTQYSISHHTASDGSDNERLDHLCCHTIQTHLILLLLCARLHLHPLVGLLQSVTTLNQHLNNRIITSKVLLLDGTPLLNLHKDKQSSNGGLILLQLADVSLLLGFLLCLLLLFYLLPFHGQHLHLPLQSVVEMKFIKKKKSIHVINHNLLHQTFLIPLLWFK